jgi:hypothetical protein
MGNMQGHPDYLPAPGSPSPVGDALLPIDSAIRYVAVNRGGRITEMTQRSPTFNPPATDQMEELLVNPAVLDLTRRRGQLDLGGTRWVLVRYGLQYQLLVPYRDGHVSIGLDLEARITQVIPVIVARLESDEHD